MPKELDDLNQKVEIIKDSFNEILSLVKGLSLRQEATEELLVVRDIIDVGELDAVEDAIKEDRF